MQSNKGVTMDKVLNFTDSQFENQVLKSDKPVLVDFWATWCGPCHMIAPIIKELAEEFDGQATIGKLDVDQNQQTAAKYGVMSIPTLIIFQNGEEVHRFVGVRPKSELAAKLNYYMAGVTA